MVVLHACWLTALQPCLPALQQVHRRLLLRQRLHRLPVPEWWVSRGVEGGTNRFSAGICCCWHASAPVAHTQASLPLQIPAGNSKQVCKIDGSGCADCNSGITARCPAGLCCLGGQNGCSPTCGSLCCSKLRTVCRKAKPVGMQGRECVVKCPTTGSGGNIVEQRDPYFKPGTYTTYST